MILREEFLLGKSKSMGDSILQLVEEQFQALWSFRTDLRRHPELSWKETRTTGRIEQMLSAAGIEGFQHPLETGGFVDLIFREGAPFVLLRADIDALPLQDEISAPYRSENPGVCHACGHDLHTAIVVGSALVLKKLPEHPNLNLRLVFQPAEEPIPSGAPQMIRAGVLQNVKWALGMHMEPRLAAGTVCITPGWVNMQSIRLDLTVQGKGGHSARPGETADLLWLASRIIQDSYQMIYREVNLLDSLVMLTFTEIQAGRGYNLIPDLLKLTGTLRLSDPAKKNLLLRKLREYLAYLQSESGAAIELKTAEGAPAIYNDPQLCRRLQDNMSTFPLEGVSLNSDFRTPGGDDFSHYLQKVPGAMIRIGVHASQFTAGLHEGKFDAPPQALKIGVAFFVHQLLHLE